MNDASRWRLELARDRIAPAYAALDKVVVVSLVGGAARGLADRWSDLDLVVYWRQSPSPETRRAVIDALGGQDPSLDDDAIRRPDLALQSRSDVWYWGGGRDSGLKVDLSHVLVVSMAKLIADVAERHELDRGKLGLLHSLQRALPLHGAETLAIWREAAGRLPEALALALARESLPRLAPWTFEMLGTRGDALLEQRNRARELERLLDLLHALNRAHPPSDPKHLDALCAELSLAPPELAERLRKMLAARPLDAGRMLGRLQLEALELAAAALPELAEEIAAARARLATGRARRSGPPPTEG